jgi:hormone-sensitive lipase
MKLFHNIKERFNGELKVNAAVIHVHGGGFVAMSSASHQCYTRLWADSLGVPIFSIDYRLAPKD